ncbi:tetratricopeptide repeat protein [Actinopolymorpha alba]|uniref:tetratricopeptide repeat protein n=1 Tax=Actinopolymorpha alba TaxID=533267 RepID=UPI00035D4B59|nr:tetratricopeptide repeat protein [Actinopolymorpha alba]
MTSESFTRPGALDLSGLGRTSAAPAAGGQSRGAAQGSYVVDVTEANFQQEVVERSITVPVVVDFWAEWCEPCKQLSPILERLSAEYAGRFVLAKIDVDQNPRIAQSAGVQSIPLVVAVVRGQLVPLFQGALPEAQVRQFIDELLRLAVSQGVTGTAEPAGSVAEDAELVRDPRYADADAAMERGDIDGAISAFEKLLQQAPGDAEAKRGLAQVRLLSRVRDFQPAQVQAEAAAKPDDAQAQCAAADLEVVGGHLEDGFARLIDAVRRTAGDERNAIRMHLLELFDAVGAEDERVMKARRLLSTALF